MTVKIEPETTKRPPPESSDVYLDNSDTHYNAPQKSINVRKLFEQRREEEELLKQIRDIYDEDF